MDPGSSKRLPSLQALICLRTVAHHGSFSDAARALNITQSAVSRQIAALEETIGHPLFSREHRRVEINHRGRQFLRALTAPLYEIELALRTARLDEAPRRTVTVGTYATLAARWLVPRAICFEAAHPDIRIDVTAFDFLSEFRPADVSLAILQGQQAAGSGAATVDFLMPEVLVAVCAPKLIGTRPKTLDTLLSLPLVRMPTLSQAWSRWLTSLGEPMRMPRVAGEYVRPAMLIEALLAGAGFAIFQKALIERELTEGSLALAHPHHARGAEDFHLVSTKVGLKEADSGLFRAWLVERCKAEQGDAPGIPGLR